MILAIVHPLGDLGLALASKLVSVELTNEVLCGRTAERTAWVDVAEKHPLLLVGAANLHLHQVRAFPHTAMIAVLSTERALVSPVFQVVRRIDVHLLTGSENHVPLLDILVPEHMWIAEVGHVACDDRVALILGEGLSVVSTVGHALSLVLASRGIESHDSTLAEASGILLVDNSRTAEYRTYHIRLDSFALKLPVYEIGRGGMSPGHVLPLRSIGIVLEIEVPHTILIEHTVRVVHPAIGRSMMIERTILLTVLHVETVGELHSLPASEVGNTAVISILSVDMNIEHQSLLALVSLQVERYIIIYVRIGKADIECLQLLVVGYHLDMTHFGTLLNRYQKIFLTLVNTIEAMVVAQELSFLGRG